MDSLDVFTPNDGAVAVFGDSISEGAYSKRPYSTVLAQRLAVREARGGPRFGVINTAIAGNRVLQEGTGPAGARRFRRDVTTRTGVRYALVMEGINDIGIIGELADVVTGRSDEPLAIPSVEELTRGYRTMAHHASRAGIRMFLSPMTPAGSAPRSTQHSATPEQVERRHEVNKWIRRSRLYTTQVDYDVALANPVNKDWLRLEADSGDNVHPNTTGHELMGDSVNLDVFGGSRC